MIFTRGKYCPWTLKKDDKNW